MVICIQLYTRQTFSYWCLDKPVVMWVVTSSRFFFPMRSTSTSKYDLWQHPLIFHARQITSTVLTDDDSPTEAPSSDHGNNANNFGVNDHLHRHRSTIQQTAQVLRIPLLQFNQRLTMMDFPTTVLHMTRQERAAHHHHHRRRRRQIVMIRPRPSSRSDHGCLDRRRLVGEGGAQTMCRPKRQKLLETASRQLSHKNKVRSSIFISSTYG